MNSYRDKASVQSKIMLTVKSDKRFKCGGEVKKKIDLYCLRIEAPPTLDDKKLSIPSNILLSVDLLNNLGIKFITGQAPISEKSKILKMPEMTHEIEENDKAVFETPPTVSYFYSKFFAKLITISFSQILQRFKGGNTLASLIFQRLQLSQKISIYSSKNVKLKLISCCT